MTITGRALIVAAVATLAAAGCGSATGQPAGSASTPVTAASHQAKARPAVTYVVTGSPASVTYGPAGSNHHGSVPLHITRPLRSALFYSVHRPAERRWLSSLQDQGRRQGDLRSASVRLVQHRQLRDQQRPADRPLVRHEQRTAMTP